MTTQRNPGKSAAADKPSATRTPPRKTTQPPACASANSTRRYLTRDQVRTRLKRLIGGRSLRQCAEDWQVPVQELSKILRGDPHRYPGERLRARLRVGREEVLWPEVDRGGNGQ